MKHLRKQIVVVRTGTAVQHHQPFGVSRTVCAPVERNRSRCTKTGVARCWNWFRHGRAASAAARTECNAGLHSLAFTQKYDLHDVARLVYVQCVAVRLEICNGRSAEFDDYVIGLESAFISRTAFPNSTQLQS